MDLIFRVCRNYSFHRSRLSFRYSYDVMNDIGCVELIYRQRIVSKLALFFCSFGGGSELMRDGDVLELLPALERALKYEIENF